MATSTRISQRLVNVSSKSCNPQYICRSCRNHMLRTRSSINQQLRYASQQNLPFTEKLRRRIWGTDNPPGMADPYGGPSFLERYVEKRKQGKEMKQSIEPERAHQHRTPRVSNTPTTATPRPQKEEYEEATTWDRLQHVGHKGNWRDLPPQPQDHYTPWIARVEHRASNRAELLSCLYQSIVECLLYKSMGKNPRLACDGELQQTGYDAIFNSRIVLSKSGTISHAEGDLEQIERTFLHRAQDLEEDHERELQKDPFAQLHAEVDGKFTRQAQKLEQDLLHSMDIGVEESTPKEQFENHEMDFEEEDWILDVKYFVVPSEEFLTARLDFSDPLSFAILKRFSQLSQHRIPDPVLNSLQRDNSRLGYLVENLTESLKPKPKKLAEKLILDENLANHSNVMLLSRRETPVDREKEVGRWKVIEKELSSRGLPVLGRVSS